MHRAAAQCGAVMSRARAVALPPRRETMRVARSLLLAGLTGLATATPALADPFTTQLLNNNALQFAVLGTFASDQINFNNGTINGDIGVGSPREFTISNASLYGNVRFSGATSTAGFLGGPC